jgi:phenylalanyl-tRNA synthetase beta chain
MPTLAVSKTFLFSLLEKPRFTEEEFDALCFEFGVELDEVTSQRKIFLKEHASLLKDPAQKKALEEKLAQLSEDELYKIDTPANRYDLLSAEGMAIALRVFMGTLPAPRYRVLPPQLTMSVKNTTRNVRDFVICAVLRDIKFTAESYSSFVDFQEKLHGGLARKRTLCSVGTHDLDKVKAGTFTYECMPKDQIKFVPLNQKGRVLDCTGDGLEKFYNPTTDRHISKYVPLISHLDKYPVILDAERRLMSLPPIINSDFSKIDQSTTNVFIECTAPEYHKASSLVNQMVCAFSWYCKEQFTVEAVKVEYEDPSALIETKRMLHKSAVEAAKFRGDDRESARLLDVIKSFEASSVDITPSLDTRIMNVDVPTMNSRVGIQVDAQRCAQLLEKMMLPSTVINETTVQVEIPANRSDVLHPCDLVEDCAIAYGYDNIAMTEVPTRSAGTQTPMNKLAHLLRLEVAAAGYTEMLTFSLCSRDEAFKFLRREDRGSAVHIANPQTLEFQVCRPSLLPGTLKTFQHNKSQPLPLRLFEVSDVVVKDASTRTGARNERHFAALHAQADSSSFEDVHGLCEYVLRKVGIAQKTSSQTDDEMLKEGHAAWYTFKAFDDDQDAYFPGRAMEVLLTTVNGASKKACTTRVGTVGVLHPRVLRSKLIDSTSQIDMAVPCSYVELNLEPLLSL